MSPSADLTSPHLFFSASISLYVSVHTSNRSSTDYAYGHPFNQYVHDKGVVGIWSEAYCGEAAGQTLRNRRVHGSVLPFVHMQDQAHPGVHLDQYHSNVGEDPDENQLVWIPLWHRCLKVCLYQLRLCHKRCSWS